MITVDVSCSYTTFGFEHSNGPVRVSIEGIYILVLVVFCTVEPPKWANVKYKVVVGKEGKRYKIVFFFWLRDDQINLYKKRTLILIVHCYHFYPSLALWSLILVSFYMGTKVTTLTSREILRSFALGIIHFSGFYPEQTARANCTRCCNYECSSGSLFFSSSLHIYEQVTVPGIGWLQQTRALNSHALFFLRFRISIDYNNMLFQIKRNNLLIDMVSII